MLTVSERLTNGGRFELLPVHTACVAELFDAVAESKNEISPWDGVVSHRLLGQRDEAVGRVPKPSLGAGQRIQLSYSRRSIEASFGYLRAKTTCMPDIDSPTWAIGYVLLGHEKVQRRKRSGCSSILDLQPLGWSGLRLSSQ
jgi:hypothetical protein